MEVKRVQKLNSELVRRTDNKTAGLNLQFIAHNLRMEYVFGIMAIKIVIRRLIGRIFI